MSGLNNDKTTEFITRWRDIERDAARLDYERSRLSAEIRAEFEAGTSGDACFIRWCETELSINQFKSDELLLRGRAFSIISDERTWRLAGGFKGVRLIIGLGADDQRKVIDSVLSTGKSPRTILKEMGAIPMGNKIFHSSPDERVSRLQSDAITLAEFVATQLGDSAPHEIAEVVRRYVRSLAKRKAA